MLCLQGGNAKAAVVLPQLMGLVGDDLVQEWRALRRLANMQVIVVKSFDISFCKIG